MVVLLIIICKSDIIRVMILLRRCTEARIQQNRKPPFLKKYDIVMSKNIYNLLSIHIFLQKSVFWIFKTTKTKVINKRKNTLRSGD